MLDMLYRLLSKKQWQPSKSSVSTTTFNKKSELMLMRHATASIQFRTQAVLVYLQ